MIANNPAVGAYVEILADPQLPDRAYVVSIGTGDQHESYDLGEAEGWGLLDWATRIVDVAIDGTQHEADRHLDRALCGPRDVYHRFLPSLDPEDHPVEGQPSGKLDDASPENQDALEALAGSFLDEHRGQVSRIADELSAMVPDRAAAGRRSVEARQP